MSAPVRVFLVADEDRGVQRLIHAFDQAQGFTVTGSGLTSSPRLARLPSDVVVIQTKDPERLLGTLQSILPTVYLVSSGGPHSVAAEAVLPSDADSAQIRAAAMAVATGLRVQSIAASRHDDSDSEFAFLEPLTEREMSVLNFMADGFSNPEIAKRLGISRNTAKFHVSSILSKLGASSRTEAVATALKRGLIIV